MAGLLILWLSVCSALVPAADRLRAEGRLRDAEVRYRAAPACPGALLHLGGLLYDQGRYAEAAALLQPAATVLEGAPGADRRQAALIYNTLGLVLLGRADYAAAETALARAAAIFAEDPGDRATLVRCYGNLSVAQLMRGELSEAVRNAARARDLADALEPADALLRIESLSNLAAVYVSEGELGRAKSAVLRATEQARHSLGTDHPEMARLLGLSGRIHEAERYYELAAADLEGAIRIAERTAGPESPRLVGYLQAYAAVLREQRHRAEARRVEARVKMILQGE